MLPFNVFNYPRHDSVIKSIMLDELYEVLSSGVDIQTNDPVTAQAMADIVPGLSVILVPDDPDVMEDLED